MICATTLSRWAISEWCFETVFRDPHMSSLSRRCSPGRFQPCHRRAGLPAGRASKAKVCARPCRAHFRATRHDRYRVFVSADVRRRAATMKTLDDDNRLRQDVMGPPRMSLVRRRRTRALAYWLAEQLWMQRWPFDSSRRELLHRRRRYRPAGLCRSSSSLASALVLILNAAQRYCCSGAQAGKPFTLQWSPHRQ